MTVRSRAALSIPLALVLAAALLLAGVSGLPAEAGMSGTPTPTPTEPPTPVPEGPIGSTPPRQEGTNEPATAQVRTCSLFAGDGSYGLTCRGGVVGTLTYAEILGPDPVPECWHEEVPPDFVPPRLDPDEPRGGTWWLKTCLIGGIDRETKESTGELRFSQELDYVDPTEDVLVLTDRQEQVVEGQRDVSQIPFPFVQTSPSASPRVGQDVAFYSPPSNTRGSTITVSGPGVGTVSMRARMTGLSVWPDGNRPEPRVGCAGGGVEVGRDDTRASTPGACWWSFDRSSAHLADRAYPMFVSADWVVEYDGGAGWTTLGTFTREQVTDQPVTEIQTIVVP